MHTLILQLSSNIFESKFLSFPKCNNRTMQYKSCTSFGLMHFSALFKIFRTRTFVLGIIGLLLVLNRLVEGVNGVREIYKIYHLSSVTIQTYEFALKTSLVSCQAAPYCNFCSLFCCSAKFSVYT